MNEEQPRAAGGTVVHALLDVMAAKRLYAVISRAMHLHRTVAESVRTLLQQLKALV